MSITVQSTTDTPEAVTAALGGLAEKVVEPVEEKKSASTPKEEDETAEESEASESEVTDETETEEPEEKPKKKSSGFKKKISKLTARVSTAEREKEYWREQALRNQKPDSEKQIADSKKPAPEGKPKADDFESHDDYVEALVDWKADQKLLARDAKTKGDQAKTEHQKLVETHLSRVEAFKKAHADFDEMMEDVDDIPLNITVQQLILESGPELQYELMKNRDELERICKLPAIACAREIGKIEARLVKESESSDEKLKITKAPPPLKPVKSGSTGSGKKSIYDAGLSQREYEQLRKEQVAKRA